MRKRLVRALVFVAVALGVAVGAAGAAGAIDFEVGESRRHRRHPLGVSRPGRG